MHKPDEENPFASAETYLIDLEANNIFYYASEAVMAFDVGQGVCLSLIPKVLGNGKYTISDDSIIVYIEEDTLQVILNKEDMKVTGVDDEAAIEQLKTLLYDEFSKNIEQIAQEFAGALYLDNVVVTGDKMVCISDGESMTFTRLPN